MATSAVLSDLSRLSDRGKDALAEALLKNLGDLTQYKVTKNYVLVGLHIGGEKFAGSTLYRPDSNKKEDVYQSNCGIILKRGPSAFVNADGSDEPEAPAVGDWIYYRGGNQRLQINGMDYAYLHEDNIVGTVPDPATITHRT